MLVGDFCCFWASFFFFLLLLGNTQHQLVASLRGCSQLQHRCLRAPCDILLLLPTLARPLSCSCTAQFNTPGHYAATPFRCCLQKLCNAFLLPMQDGAAPLATTSVSVSTHQKKRKGLQVLLTQLRCSSTQCPLPSGRPPSALVVSLRGWGQLQRSCLRAPL